MEGIITLELYKLAKRIYYSYINHKEIDEVIEQLEGTDFKRAIERVYEFNGLQEDKYGNSYLTRCVVYGRHNAALTLLAICDGEGINYQDKFTGSRSTPLILCAKTHANIVGLALLNRGADPNLSDYRGFTALHYACMYRNHELIYALLAAGADPSRVNVFGKKPYDYYQMEIDIERLQYHYGSNTQHQLKLVCDFGESNFQATELKDLSAIRWFIHNIIVNAKLGKTREVDDLDKLLVEGKPVINMMSDALFYHHPINPQSDAFSLAELHVSLKRVIYDARLYKTMMQEFCIFRSERSIKPALLNHLNALSPLSQAQRSALLPK